MQFKLEVRCKYHLVGWRRDTSVRELKTWMVARDNQGGIVLDNNQETLTLVLQVTRNFFT